MHDFRREMCVKENVFLYELLLFLHNVRCKSIPMIYSDIFQSFIRNEEVLNFY